MGFSGLGDTLEESTNEIENRACQVYLDKALFSILFVISARISLNAQTNSTKVFGEPFYKKAQNKNLVTKSGENLLFLKRIVSLGEVGVDY